MESYENKNLFTKLRFRAKKEKLTEENRAYTDGWIYGDSIYKDDDGTYIIPDGVSAESYHLGTYDFRANSDKFKIMVAKVDPQTLGVSTGIFDKSGNEVFTGDIVNCRVLRISGNHGSWCKETNKNHGKCRVIPMEVYYIEPFTNFDQMYGGIGFKPTQKAKELIKEYEKPIGLEQNKQLINYFNICEDDILEIVGNIYDGLEEETDD